MPEYLIPNMKPKPKARPRVTSRNTYMPHDYQAWRSEIRECLRYYAGWADPIDYRFNLVLIFRSPNRPRGDSDNLLGGILDAIQATKSDPRGVILDDRLLGLHFCGWKKSKETRIEMAFYREDEIDNFTARILSAIVA